MLHYIFFNGKLLALSSKEAIKREVFILPTSLSAKKRTRQAQKRTQRNREIRSQIKTSIRRFTEAVNKKEQEHVYPRFQQAVRTLDKAASKGVIHKNNAARKKSQLTRLYQDYQSKIG